MGHRADESQNPLESRESRVSRVQEVRRRLVEEGPPWTRDGNQRDFTRVTVPARDCDALRDLLVAEGVESVIEVGLAYASSALAIGEALVAGGAPHPVHVVIDPFQDSAWENVGWNQLGAAGLDSIARLVLEPSSQALPGLVADGFTADAAYVDGNHRFHAVFVDLYFLRTIVRPGGLVILDDYWWPSVRTAVRYYETNLGWEVLPDAFAGATVHEESGHPRTRALRLPDPSVEPGFDRFVPF